MSSSASITGWIICRRLCCEVKLPHLDSWNDDRRRAAGIYNELLKEVPGVITPLADEERTHVYHLYVIQHPRRDELLARLKDEGVRAGLHYPIPGAFAALLRRLSFLAGFIVGDRIWWLSA